MLNSSASRTRGFASKLTSPSSINNHLHGTLSVPMIRSPPFLFGHITTQPHLTTSPSLKSKPAEARKVEHHLIKHSSSLQISPRKIDQQKFAQICCRLLLTITTTTIQWKCTCGATCKIVHQVTTCCPDLHACHCWCYAGPSARNPPRTPHDHQDIFALIDDFNTRRVIAPDPGPPVAQLWVPDHNMMMQQLKEFQSLSDEVVALRLQLEEYKEEIEKSKRDNAGRNWFVPLPDNIRNVLVKARDVLNSPIAISTPPKN